MMLGKRARPPMKRTTSITEFTIDLESSLPLDPRMMYINSVTTGSGSGSGSGLDGYDHRFLSTISPRNPRRSSADFNHEATHFLRACGLCNRRLTSGKDIFMYRGDTAFCSSECRQQQIIQDERKEKCSSYMKESVTTSVGSHEQGTSCNGSSTVAAA